MIESDVNVKWESGAIDQVVSIYDHLKNNATSKVADGVYEAITNAVDNLAIFPEMSPKDDRTRARRFTMKLPYYIYYDFDEAENVIRIIAILHQKHK